MKNFIYNVKRQCDEDCDFFCHYCDDENSVSVWADTYPFKIDFKFAKRSVNKLQEQKLRDKFGVEKHMSKQPEYKKTSHGKLNLVFNTSPQLKSNKTYQMSVDFVEIDWRYRLKTAKFKIFTDNSDQVVETGKITDEKLLEPQVIVLFLMRLVKLFYQKLIKLGVSLENQLTSSYWLRDRFELNQSVYLRPQKEKWKFNFKIEQFGDEYVYRKVQVDLGDKSELLKWNGNFNGLLKLIEDIEDRIEDFARSKIKEWLKNNDARISKDEFDPEIDEFEKPNEDTNYCDGGVDCDSYGKYSVDDFETSQRDDDRFSFKIWRDYRVSDYDKPLTVCADIKLVWDELLIEENEESDFWVKKSVMSEKSRVVLDDFDTKSQTAIKEWCATNWKEEIENYDSNSGGTLNRLSWSYRGYDDEDDYGIDEPYDENEDYE